LIEQGRKEELVAVKSLPSKQLLYFSVQESGWLGNDNRDARILRISRRTVRDSCLLRLQDSPPRYSYGYDITGVDGETSAQESRDGDLTAGRYTVKQPDGP
jgi:hypothetical protein